MQHIYIIWVWLLTYKEKAVTTETDICHGRSQAYAKLVWNSLPTVTQWQQQKKTVTYFRYCKKHAEVSMCGTPAHQYVYVKLLIINLKPPSFVSPQTIGKHPHDTVQIKKVKQTLKKIMQPSSHLCCLGNCSRQVIKWLPGGILMLLYLLLKSTLMASCLLRQQLRLLCS